VTKAHEIAETLRALGTRMNDPRSLGLAMHNRSWAALFSDDYSTGLKFAEACLSIASCSPYDQQSTETGKAVALALLRRPELSRCFGIAWPSARPMIGSSTYWDSMESGASPLSYVGRSPRGPLAGTFHSEA
jgi:hypothetical protein